MAAGILQKPGTKGGPCETECKHRDCAMTREDAAKVCRRCGKAIGYETRFYNDGPGHLVHALCEEKAAERGEA